MFVGITSVNTVVYNIFILLPLNIEYFFQENFCLWPGNSEIAAKYREKIYYFSSIENQETFIADPLKYLPHNKPFVPPPPRILLIGARGSGKTTQGRHFAKELQIFHVTFRERLQVIQKSNVFYNLNFD